MIIARTEAVPSRQRARGSISFALILGLAAAAAAGDDTTRTSSIFAPVSAPADAVLYGRHARAGDHRGHLRGRRRPARLLRSSRFRRRPDDDGSEPPQVYGSDQIELAWTVIPILIVVVLFLVTARTVYDVQARAEAARRARGHRRRPPVVVGDPLSRARHRHRQRAARAGERSRRARRPTFLALESADVAHSFWVPRLAGKTDLIPNRAQPDVDRAARAGALPRPVRRVLRHAAREDAAAGLRAHARRVRPLGRGAATARGADRRRRDGPAGLRDDGLRQLPHRARHGRRRALRAGPDAPDEPRDARRRRGAEHAARSCAPGSTIPTT